MILWFLAVVSLCMFPRWQHYFMQWFLIDLRPLNIIRKVLDLSCGEETMRTVFLNSIHTADTTQLSSWVASAVCIELPTVADSLDESEQICQQQRRVASCRLCDRTHRQSWPSLQFCSVVNWVATANGCLRTADTTQLGRINSQHVQFPNFRPNLSVVVASWLWIQYAPHDESKLRCDSTRQLSRVHIGGVYWVLVLYVRSSLYVVYHRLLWASTDSMLASEG